MRLRTFCFILTATAAVVLFHAGSTALHGAALTSAALTGQVSSAEEGQMEGVLVTAKKTGSTIAITVASDQTGHYSFPRNRLEPVNTPSASAPSAMKWTTQAPSTSVKKRRPQPT